MKILTPTQRLHTLLQWALNAHDEMEYQRRLEHFQRYLEKQYRKTLKKHFKCQDGNN